MSLKENKEESRIKNEWGNDLGKDVVGGRQNGNEKKKKKDLKI